MRKLNYFQMAGLFFITVLLISHQFGLLPDFVLGLCAGIGIGLLLLGLYAYNHDISKIRNYKMNFLKKCFGKLMNTI